MDISGASPAVNGINRRSFAIANRPCHVFDGMVSSDSIERIYASITSMRFTRTESDRSDTQHVRTFAAEVPAEFVGHDPIFQTFNEIVSSLFKDEDLQAYRAYVNMILYGDMSYSHRDCALDRSDVTVLYYANREWKREWMGETIFFDDDGDARAAVAPKPGRIVVFRGAIDHRVGIPSRDCHDERLTLAYKYKAPGQWK